MTVSDPNITELCRESAGVELRIRPGAGDRAYVDEQIDRDLPEQSHEFDDRSGRMADGEDCPHRFRLFSTGPT
jgi:hypothetical protein